MINSIQQEENQLIRTDPSIYFSPPPPIYTASVNLGHNSYNIDNDSGNDGGSAISVRSSA